MSKSNVVYGHVAEIDDPFVMRQVLAELGQSTSQSHRRDAAIRFLVPDN